MRYLPKLPFIVFGMLWAILSACNNANRNENLASDDTTMQDPIVDTEATESAVLDQDSILVDLEDGHAEQQATMKKGRHVVFLFDTKAHVKLNARVKADAPNGNVRIAQLFTPDNNADGPFGQDLEYDLKEPGQYRLVISENQMAGDPYDGPFTLELSLSTR